MFAAPLIPAVVATVLAVPLSCLVGSASDPLPFGWLTGQPLIDQSLTAQARTDAITPLAQAAKPAQAPKPAPATKPAPAASPAPVANGSQSPWFFVSAGLGILLLAGGGYGKYQLNALEKKLRSEEFRTRELKKRLDLSLKTLHKMETNPDLIDAREFNLDYLRMRMQEETFNFSIVNQIKMKVKTLISVALRPTQQQAGTSSASPNNAPQAGQARQVDQIFPVEYETNDGVKKSKRVLFRVQIRLAKLPTQPTSKTIEEIIHCLERYLSLDDERDEHWQPKLQDRLATISWDQKAKPTPLLVMSQSNEGVNVTMRTKRGPRLGT